MKSDDTVGRVKTFEAIVKGNNIPKPGVPESFKVLIKELQSLALDVKVLDKDNQEIDLKQTFDDDEDVGLGHMDDDLMGMEHVKSEDELADSYTIDEPENDESDNVLDTDDLLGLDDGDDLFEDENY